MEILTNSEIKRVNGGEKGEATDNGRKAGNVARQTKNLIKDIGEAISPFK